MKNFEIVKIGKLINCFLDYLQLFAQSLEPLFSSSPMSQDGQICMCGACNALYYNLLFVILKNLKKYDGKAKVLDAMCKVIGTSN